MISGIVNDSIEPRVQVRVFGTEGRSSTVDAVIDTGFSGYLALSQMVIHSLCLPFLGERKAQLADGEFVDLRLFRAAVDWNGQNRGVQIIESEGGPLVGMAMLRGFQLCIDVAPLGAVLVKPLP